MLGVIVLFLLVFSNGAQAQLPLPPPNVQLSADDIAVVQRALDYVVTTVGDPALLDRVKEIKKQDLSTVDPRSLPIMGLALSRYSKDPKTCALLKRIEPSAVCATR